MNFSVAVYPSETFLCFNSDVEEKFARSFELNDEAKVYAKLPGWFKIDTPLGSYNPDWAVLVKMEGQERLYFVVESKSGLFTNALRPTEQAKTDCGREHFKAQGPRTKSMSYTEGEVKMDEVTFAKFMNHRQGTYHLVDDQGHRIARKETGRWLFGTFIDYKDKLVLFENPSALKETVLKIPFRASDWAVSGDEVMPCDCGTDRCEGRLVVKLFTSWPAEGWSLEVAGN